MMLKDYTVNVYAPILTVFENLKHLSIIGSFMSDYPALSLCDLPSTTFFSSILTKLCIYIWAISRKTGHTPLSFDFNFLQG